MSALDALRDVAAAVNVPTIWLANLIKAESNFDPRAHNPLPGSTARGLLQFTDARAQSLGFSNSQQLIDQYPTVEVQLRGPVLRDLQTNAPYPTKQSFYLSIFYPDARNWPLDTKFPPEVTRGNPGIETPRDYIQFVDSKGITSPWVLVPVVFALGLLGLLIWRVRK